ncbi:MAG: M23 family metallopeptidase [Clostridia bacterium]|nr:M23 family metallopeptidase [Clostridia bacterium]
MSHTDKVRTVKVIRVPKKYYSAGVINPAPEKNEFKLTCEKLNIKKKVKKVSAHRSRVKRIAALAAAITFATAITFVTSSYAVGYTVTVDDTVIGTVATKDEYYEVLDMVKTEVKDTADEEFIVDGQETFEVGVVKRADLTEKGELAENIKSTSEDMVTAFAITCDGKIYAALSTKEEAESVIDAYLEKFTGGNENITTEFIPAVEIIETHVLESAVKLSDDVYEELLKGKLYEHTVESGETIESIAFKYGVSPERILTDNGIFAESNISEMTLKIYTDEPVFSVKTVEYIDGEVEIPFETVSNEDDTLYIGKTAVEKKGVPGVKFLKAYITRVNGEITEEKILKNKVLKEPTSQIERVGTKKLPNDTGTGKFVMPASGELTSSFGRRWGRAHQGMDVGAKVGTPIYASDNGRVIVSEFNDGGYGYMISIDHNNGYVTNYAHCSELLVDEGDVVAKGDLIARVGNTGRSTGPHLHFEIRKDGKAQNPEKYVK